MVSRTVSQAKRELVPSNRINCKLQLPKRNFGESGSSVCIQLSFPIDIDRTASFDSSLFSFSTREFSNSWASTCRPTPFQSYRISSRRFSIGTDICFSSFTRRRSRPPFLHRTNHRPTARNSQVATASFLKIILGCVVEGCFFFYCVPMLMGRMEVAREFGK